MNKQVVKSLNRILYSCKDEQIQLLVTEGMKHSDEKCALCTQPAWHAIQALLLASWELLGKSLISLCQMDTVTVYVPQAVMRI